MDGKMEANNELSWSKGMVFFLHSVISHQIVADSCISDDKHLLLFPRGWFISGRIGCQREQPRGKTDSLQVPGFSSIDAGGSRKFFICST